MITCDVTDTWGSWPLDGSAPAVLVCNLGPDPVNVSFSANDSAAPLLLPNVTLRLGVNGPDIYAVTAKAGGSATLTVAVEDDF
jgi:hypothetical protein